MKNYTIIIVGLLFIVIIVYLLYCVVETRSVMMEIRNVEKGKQVNERDPLYAFAPKKGFKIINVKRYFTWCWGNTGRIWISMQYEIEYDKEIVPDYCELAIRKENGKWKAIKYIYTP